jgi:uncharacterized protein YhaN
MTQLSKELINTIEKYSNTIKKIDELDKQIKTLKEEKEVYAEVIKESFETNKPTETPYGYITITTRRSWKDFPSDIIALEENLKELKAKAKQVGNVGYEIIKIISLK